MGNGPAQASAYSPQRPGTGWNSAGAGPVNGGVIRLINNLLVRLRGQRGFTQEELSELSGISVRTIRNLERGQIQKPRRSSVEMLLNVLAPELLQELRAQPPDDPGVSSGSAAQWWQLAGPGAGNWRGPKPPRTSLVGRDAEIERLADLVTAHQVVVVTGPGGVGKSRVALAVAELVGHRFADGVAVAEMGRIPGEQHLGAQPVMDLAMGAVVDLLEAEPGPLEGRLLLVLDNTEHLVRTTAQVVDRLLTAYPGLHVLVTSRRLPELHDAGIWEIPPLRGQAAVDLLVQRLATSCPTLDLSDELPQVAALCELLDGLPRLIEFAAHRLRMVSLPSLLSDNRAMRQLGSTDFSALPHQRTLEASLRWSLDLLDERQQRFLARLARLPDVIRLHIGEFGGYGGELSGTEAVGLLADLAGSSLLQVERGHQYEYRVLRHVKAFLSDVSDVSDVPEPVGSR
jgi:predicted ATPase